MKKINLSKAAVILLIFIASGNASGQTPTSRDTSANAANTETISGRENTNPSAT